MYASNVKSALKSAPELPNTSRAACPSPAHLQHSLPRQRISALARRQRPRGRTWAHACGDQIEAYRRRGPAGCDEATRGARHRGAARCIPWRRLQGWGRSSARWLPVRTRASPLHREWPRGDAPDPRARGEHGRASADRRHDGQCHDGRSRALSRCRDGRLPEPPPLAHVRAAARPLARCSRRIHSLRMHPTPAMADHAYPPTRAGTARTQAMGPKRHVVDGASLRRPLYESWAAGRRRPVGHALVHVRRDTDEERRLHRHGRKGSTSPVADAPQALRIAWTEAPANRVFQDRPRCRFSVHAAVSAGAGGIPEIVVRCPRLEISQDHARPRTRLHTSRSVAPLWRFDRDVATSGGTLPAAAIRGRDRTHPAASRSMHRNAVDGSVQAPPCYTTSRGKAEVSRSLSARPPRGCACAAARDASCSPRPKRRHARNAQSCRAALHAFGVASCTDVNGGLRRA